MIWTRARLRAQILALGIGPGDVVMSHAGLRSVGRILGGPDALIGAFRDVLGPQGTLMAYTDWAEDFGGEPGDPPAPDLRDQVQPFDAKTARATRDNGAWPELLRTTPGALRSQSPGPSCAAIGARAEWLLADHALDYGYGARSPLARLVAVGGKVALIGCPLDTITLLHHAEHLADIPNKRIKRYEAPFLVDGRTLWRPIEEFDTSIPVVEGLDEDYFARIVEAFLATGRGRRGPIGDADTVLVPAADIVAFAVAWLESRFR